MTRREIMFTLNGTGMSAEQARQVQSAWSYNETKATLKVEVQQRKPEQDVLDDIDRLVDESLQREMYCRCGNPENCCCDYASDDMPPCELCQGDWHGLPDLASDCPGAYGSDAEKQQWRENWLWPAESSDSAGVTCCGASMLVVFDEATVLIDADGMAHVFRNRSNTVVPQPDTDYWWIPDE